MSCRRIRRSCAPSSEPTPPTAGGRGIDGRARAFPLGGVEPEPGTYDDGYIARVLEIKALLARDGIYTLTGFHQDFWSRTAQPDFGDGAPAWATVGAGSPESVNDSFAAFWRDDPGPGGVGIQTRFLRAWQHVAQFVRDRPYIIGIDPLNEPYPGADYAAPCGPFTRCPPFESGALADFYRRVAAAIRRGGARQVIFPERRGRLGPAAAGATEARGPAERVQLPLLLLGDAAQPERGARGGAIVVG
jgi:endoglycosylceramidase